MPQITRTWLAFAALGAGMVHLALVGGSPLAFGIPLALLGAAEVAWGVLAFVRTDLVAPRIARTVAFAPTVAWSLLVVAATLFDAPALIAPLALVPMAVGAAFGLFVGAVLTVHLRDRGVASAPRALPNAPRYLLALTAGAVVVGAMTTPALAATEAGRFAQPHGAHQAGFVPEEDPAGILTDADLPGHPDH